jgi:hypothetical protein
MNPEKIRLQLDRDERTDLIAGHTSVDTQGHAWIREGDPGEGLSV